MALPPTAREIAAAVAAGRNCAADGCRAALARIGAWDGRLQAFLEVHHDAALQRAATIDQARDAGETLGPLAGVPIAVKDNICTRGGHTTCASRFLQRYASPYAATAVERLEAAGGIVIGKTNLDEFAMGSSTENSGRFATRNPWDLTRVPGGSSGGSAAAVAAGLTPLALGSDTGGSVRQPAAFCGIVGLKPTYGRVSRFGLVAYGSSLDQIGTLARNVGDAALLLQLISGPDPRDSTSLAEPAPDLLAELARAEDPESVRGLRIGVPREYFGEGLDPRVRSAVESALEVYWRAGAQRVDLDLPHTSLCVATYYLIATAEASSNLARFDGVRYGHRSPLARQLEEVYSLSREEGFGPEVKRRIMLGTFALSSGYYDQYYNKALRVRRLIQQDFLRAFEEVNVIAGPTTPTPAFRLGEKTDDPLQMYLADVYTLGANLAGVPAISIPCGLADGLPVGLQLTAAPCAEHTVVRAARIFEVRTDWHTRVPAETA